MLQSSIAQTFVFRSQQGIGYFLSKIAVYFAAKDANNPVTLELREVTNGIISDKILPFSKVTLEASDVEISNDASVATVFIFETPVFIEEEVEYAMVISTPGGSPNYRLWYANVGEDDIRNGNKITEQPHVGILHVSTNNSTFSAEQNADLKFEIFRTVFTSNTGDVVLKNTPIQIATITNATATFVGDEQVFGEVRLTVSSIANGSLVVNNTITGATSGVTGTIRSVAGNNIRVSVANSNPNFTIAEALSSNNGATALVSSYTYPSGKVIKIIEGTNNQELYMYDVSPSVPFIAGEHLRTFFGKTAYLNTLGSDMRFDASQKQVDYLNFGLTFVNFEQKATADGYIKDSNYIATTVGETFEEETPHYIATRVNEIASLASAPSYELRANLLTIRNTLSPALDLDRSSLIMIKNTINNDTTGETGVAGGNAIARYVTRIVTLADGQDAEDMKVYVGAYRPFNTDFKVYYKILNGEDSDNFSQVSWVEMTPNTKNSISYSASENKTDFREWEFNIPTANLTGTNGEVRYTNSAGVVFTGYKRFMIKIVLLSSNTSLVPKIKDLRVIALQK